MRWNNISAIKPGGGSVMVWECFTVSGPRKYHAITDGTMNSTLYPETLKENDRLPVHDLKLEHD